MSYELLPLPPSELRTYFRLCGDAFVPGILEAEFPGGYGDEQIEHAVRSTEPRVARRPDRSRFFKVVDPALPDGDPLGKVVGVSLWLIYPKERTEEELQQEREQGDRDEQEFGEPPGVHSQARQDFGKAITAGKDRYLGNRPYMCLAVLATRPEYQRRGVGSLSMAWGIKKADELGLPLWLESSPVGMALYKKWGFEVVGQLDWDARNYGYHDPLTHVCMLRPSMKERQPIPQS